MTKVKRITIGGFRGILAPLSLQFAKGNSSRSMVIYGRNGTGKSSVTDAWEWFHTEKINHLAREGAGPSAFPHKDARQGNSFVEVEFDDNLGTVRLNYDHNRITKPGPIGDINQFRQLALHPCHIRFEDLTRFVYLTKTERFDALAQLMGFTPQVELQKSLKRVSRKLKDEVGKYSDRKDFLENQLRDILEINQTTEEIVIESINKIFVRQNVKRVNKISEVPISLGLLTKQVESDPRAKELADLIQLKKLISELTVSNDLISKLGAYTDSAKNYSSLESDVSDLLMLGLYEQAEEIVTRLTNQGERVDICPLCKRRYEGDLYAHIKTELETLKQLKKYRDDFDTKRKNLNKILPKKGSLTEKLGEIIDELNENTKLYLSKDFIYQIKNLDATMDQVRDSLEIQLDLVKLPYIEKLTVIAKQLKIYKENVDITISLISSKISTKVEQLERDESRKILVEDQAKARNGIDLWTQYKKAIRKFEAIGAVSTKFDEIVDHYVKCNIDNVQSRFDVISSDVQEYFSILEQDTQGLGKPILKLLPDEDRAVELQVEFYGDPIYPAYRYLSESQLNSFGLAIFLASAKFFNKEFRFLILDDVINSFDGYKRPKVIDLLKQEFSDHQVLLFTHDSVWCDRLFEAFPSWVKRRFTRHEIGIGPIDTEGYSQLEYIEQLLENDEAMRAGREMGPFLEKQLQELCEAFEVLVKYNQRNEYTLDPLLDRFRIRVKEKLGKGHPLYQAIEDLQSETGFRNLCAHWKNPAIDLTYPEMRAVVNKWKSIELIIRCQEECCYKYVRYDGSRAFVCPCGSTRLEKSSA